MADGVNNNAKSENLIEVKPLFTELNAQLYKSQEEAKRLPKEPHHLQVHRAKHKVSAHDPYSASNSGVASRAQKDKLEMKAVKDGAASYAR
ncbi:hypothetical protein Leryth_008713 [Lithospermum erythrorhizon]|nr:hypothetical protein Leryth_008713 [Lithospermum erythrorhizon]